MNIGFDGANGVSTPGLIFLMHSREENVLHRFNLDIRVVLLNE